MVFSTDINVRLFLQRFLVLILLCTACKTAWPETRGPGSHVSFAKNTSGPSDPIYALPEAFQPESVRPAVLDYASKIAEGRMVMESAVGVGGSTPQQYIDFADMAELATEAELRRLLWHPSATVRVYAFWGLVRYKKVQDSLELLLQHSDDWAMLPYMSGCIVSGASVIELMAAEVHYSQKMDMGYLFELIVIRRAKEEALVAPPEPLQRESLRKKAATGDLDSLLALARMKDAQDTPFFQKHATDHMIKLFRVAAIYPQAELFAQIEELSERMLQDRYLDLSVRAYYFLAVAAYANEEARDILKAPISCLFFCSEKDVDPMAAHFAFSAAAAMNKDGYYDDLLLDYWKKERFVNSRSFQQLCGQPSDECEAMAKRALEEMVEPELKLAAGRYLSENQ
ncbi:MAG: hypothetical protein KDK23_01970 [Leptospiraceae bacterium]|nr:hypothetical protein [Leptospiraceae bacterium]